MSDAPTLEQIRRAPKVLLHDHLDGGLRAATIVELADQTGYADLPTTDPDELGAWMTRGASRKDLVLYLETFAHTVGVMQTPRGADPRRARVRGGPGGRRHRLRRGAVRARAASGARPGAGRRGRGGAGGLPRWGARDGRSRVRTLLTAMRTAARSLEIADLAVRWRDRGVCGFDIAGAEAGFPPRDTWTRSSTSAARTST